MRVSRITSMALCGLALAASAGGAWAAPATPPPAQLADMLARAAPGADRKVLRLAATAMTCALRRPELGIDPTRLSVIDYSRPSTEQRMWVFDLARQKLLFEEWVAHGRNSGGNQTEHFSNRDGSFMSSLGAFTARETYMGGNGYSLRLEGLEPGFNDHARDRAIVIHGAPYVNPTMARLQGRLGRSLGCPAVRLSVARPLIDSLRGGTLVFAYYPDKDWLARSQLLGPNCGGSVG
ncbi:murein L,D-transpeptidase catalytic domain family protein [Stenotrophomonas rhizophila]|uniref:murein L,D-transpeptidase catalytic domain family protein n=1 Tax=Stenotrophomonas rhizophila TaxID=216778 RepID=UPI001E40550D|nr:murein L,D-transpeptidase catalytic domain family protein [Stenotrophomonas rhizophila]MCC7636117.1 murein L,D-transpeptidase catalytic domain family protein [Stenotrophomonas rhizophila]MCC7665508.1 murein L,D-transpeptidase catalytic domain family protein [Stenotrophomonas rhizophila]